MRVYEFSKQSGISSKELMDELAKGGFKVNSHMAVLTSAALEFLQKKHKKGTTGVSSGKNTEEKLPKTSTSAKSSSLAKVTTGKAEDKPEQKVVKAPEKPAPQAVPLAKNKPVESPKPSLQEKSMQQAQQPEIKKEVIPEIKTVPQQPPAQAQPAYPKASQERPAPAEKKVSPAPTHHQRAASYTQPGTSRPMSSAQHAPAEQKVEQQVVVPPIALESMNVGDFADKIRKPVAEVIITLLRWGIVAAKNQFLTEDIIARLARHYGVEIVAKAKEKTEEVTHVKHSARGGTTHRLPIVVVIGHVDHGKTTLLDFIRKTRVASREKGGITQHLGAYEATTPQGNIVFIDTPGHEAFSKMRMRGIKVADIAVLVVAADDGIMPQTVEAIKHAKSMHVPVVVAINKIDKAEPAQIEAVKRGLVQYELLPEEWGGDVVIAPISAKTGQGVDQLLDMIILQSQMMELNADVEGPARGYVLEAKLEKGHGAVATVLCQHGTLRIGDYFHCGSTTGKVNALVNSRGQRVMEAQPSIPVLVAGFNDLPHAGDSFEVVTKDAHKKLRSEPDLSRSAAVAAARSMAAQGELNIILKADTHSSKEAILSSIANVAKKFEKKPAILHAAIGDVNESDVSLAASTGSTIFAFHVKTEPNAISLAQKNSITISTYDIIYKLLEGVEQFAEGKREIKMVKTKIGEAVVRQVFAIKGVGTIAGCYVRDGRFVRDGNVVIWRGNQKIGQGPIKSLQRDKKSVKEVHTGYECAFLIDGVTDWEVDDRVECFIDVPEVPKK